MVASVVTGDLTSESSSASTMSTSQSRSSVKTYRSKKYGRLSKVVGPTDTSSASSISTRQSRYEQRSVRPRQTMSVDREFDTNEMLKAHRFADTMVASSSHSSVYSDEPRRTPRFGYTADRYSNPAGRIDRDAYESIRHDLRQVKTSRFLNPMRTSAIKRKVAEVYDARSTSAKRYGVPSTASQMRTYDYASYSPALDGVPRRSRSSSLTRFGDLELEEVTPSRRPRRSASVTRVEDSISRRSEATIDDNWEVAYRRKNYSELNAEYNERSHDVRVDRDLLNYKDLSTTVVDPAGNFEPDDIRVRTLPSGKRAVTFTRTRQSGSGDKVEANSTLAKVIQKTQFMERTMSSLEEFVRRNRSMFPEDTRIYQQYKFFLLNEEQLRAIGEAPGAEVYGVTVIEKLVVPYGTDVSALLGRYYGKKDVEVEYEGGKRSRLRQEVETTTEYEVDYSKLQDDIRRKVETEWDISNRQRLVGQEEYDVKMGTRHRTARDHYDHMHSHVTPTYIKSIYGNAGLVYDDIYQRSSRVSGSYASSLTSDQESTRSSLSSRRKKRYDTAPTFTAKLRPKRCMEGQTVRFNCSVSGLPMPDVTWFHGNKIIAEGGRYNVSNNFGLLSLEINRVTKEDAGLYTIKATNLEGEVACSASLDVEEFDLEEEKKDGVRKPYFLLEANNAWAEVGYKAVIEAQASGRPSPTFKWLKDNISIEENERFKIFSDENGNTKLVIREIKPTDAGLYFCVAENKGGKAKCAATLRVVDKGQLAEQRRSRSRSRETTPLAVREPVEMIPDLPVKAQMPKAGKPWFIQVPPQEISLREGDALTIKCVIDGDPKPVVTWFKGVRELSYTKRHRILCEGRDHYMLQIPSTLLTDPGQYIVVAENANGKCQASTWVNVVPKDADIDEDTILRTLRLQLPDLEYDVEKTSEFAKTPPKFIKKLPLETEVSSGSSFEFCCAVQDDTPIEEFKTQITRKVEGDYKLIETTHNLTTGAKEVEEIPLGVTEGPKILAPLSDVTINPGGTVRMSLKVNSKVTVTWTKDGQTITDGGRYKIITEGKTLILEVAEITQEDAGSYSVTISNEQGTASASCSLTVTGGETFAK